MQEKIYDGVPGISEDTIYYIISTSSRHLRHLGLGSQLLNLIERLLPIKFDSLRILQPEGPPKYTSRILPSALSKFLRRMGPLHNLILLPGLMGDSEIFWKGASGPPHYNFIEASYYVCRILVPNNTVAVEFCVSFLVFPAFLSFLMTSVCSFPYVRSSVLVV